MRGIPGSLLTVLITHDMMGINNAHPINIPRICEHLRDPACLTATLDLLQLSLALNRVIPKLIVTLSADQQVPDHDRPAGERRRDLKHLRKGAQ